MKESGHQASIGQKQADKPTSAANRRHTFKKKEDGEAGGRAGNLMRVWLVGFQSCLGLVTLFSSVLSPFLFVYLFGHVGSSLWQAVSFISVHRLPSCVGPLGSVVAGDSFWNGNA